MILEQFIRMKENLEVDLLSFLNDKILEFQEQTGVMVDGIEVIPYQYPRPYPGPAISDVNIFTSLQRYIKEGGPVNDEPVIARVAEES
ncbi:MAG: hypothetical protein WC992_03535 [Acholeplasmataceae bacterium]|jgi:hypothetical protein